MSDQTTQPTTPRTHVATGLSVNDSTPLTLTLDGEVFRLDPNLWLSLANAGRVRRSGFSWPGGEGVPQHWQSVHEHRCTVELTGEEAAYVRRFHAVWARIDALNAADAAERERRGAGLGWNARIRALEASDFDARLRATSRVVGPLVRALRAQIDALPVRRPA